MSLAGAVMLPNCILKGEDPCMWQFLLSVKSVCLCADLCPVKLSGLWAELGPEPSEEKLISLAP